LWTGVEIIRTVDNSSPKPEQDAEKLMNGVSLWKSGPLGQRKL